MAEYLFTNKATTDLSDIWDYSLAQFSENQADLYYLDLISYCEMLAENPNIGKKYDEIDVGILGFVAKKHLIFYRILNSNEILIIRILSGNVNLKNRYRE